MFMKTILEKWDTIIFITTPFAASFCPRRRDPLPCLIGDTRISPPQPLPTPFPDPCFECRVASFRLLHRCSGPRPTDGADSGPAADCPDSGLRLKNTVCGVLSAVSSQKVFPNPGPLSSRIRSAGLCSALAMSSASQTTKAL